MGNTYHARQRQQVIERKVADVAACEAWNIRMKGHGGPAQHCSATLQRK